jgi:hypothetical protein
MKKVLLIASIIGIFMATAMDLQARSRRNDRPRNVRSGISFGLSRQAPSRNRSNSYGRYDNRSGRNVRSGISFGLSRQAPMLNRYNSYGSYDNYPGRNVAREIRMNEERIWNLEQRIDRLYRYGDDYGEIGELEQEINYLERRNDFLRNQLY